MEVTSSEKLLALVDDDDLMKSVVSSLMKTGAIETLSEDEV